MLVTQDQIVALLTGTGAFLEDHFVLKSGRHGDAYVNKALITTDTGVTEFLCAIIAFHFRDKGMELVAGPTVGAVPFTQWIADWLTRFTGKKVAAIYVDEGDDSERILKRGYKDMVDGKKVLGIEDILTTGGSAKKTVDALTEAGANVVGLAAIVNRNPEENTAEFFGVPELLCLVSRPFPDYDAGECPLCASGTPINVEVGHGAAYVKEHGQPKAKE